MGVCDNCNSEVRDGAWVCGTCGTPVTAAAPIAASDTTNPYVFSAQAQAEPQYQAQPSPTVMAAGAGTASTGAPRTGLSRLTVWVIVAAVAAVAALALWFAFFNNGDGSAFLGTWEPVASVNGAAAGLVADGGRLVVSRSSGEITVTAIDGKGQSIGPLKTDLKRGKLEFTLEYAGTDKQEELKTQLAQAFVGVLVKDFRATLSEGPADTVLLSYSGKATNDILKTTDNSVQLRRVPAQ
jgi:hypothetical protein